MYLKQYIRRLYNYIIKGIPNKVVYASISYTSPHESLKNKKILITGGGSGIGAAMAEKFKSEGAEVLIVSRSESKLKQTAERINCKYLVLDVANSTNFDSFINQAVACLDGLDILVNNAGISLHEKTFFDVNFDSFDNQINTNLRGGFFLTQSFLKYLTKCKRKGSVLFVSSETGDTMDFRPYGFTKAAINSMVQGLAYLFAKDGIRINAVAPGITSSDMTGLSSVGDIYYPQNISERVYFPEEVAELASFLLSDAAGTISGQIVTCNNGKTINVRWK